MYQYHNFLLHILKNGVRKEDRTGTGTLSAVVPPQMRFDLSQGFPAVTTKELDFDGIKFELKWFMNGDTNIKYLVDHGVNIWFGDAHRWYKEAGGTMSKKEFIKRFKESDGFARAWGELGPIYGRQWRGWDTGKITMSEEAEYPFTRKIDQLATVVRQIEEVKNGNFKNARRLIVSAWNVGALEDMALPPCHVMMQFFVVEGKLSCHLYQRSGDSFLGIPYNIASYSLLTHIIAKQTGLEVGEFIHTVGDAHIYLNHLDQVAEQVERMPYPLPTLNIPDNVTIDNWDPNEVSLNNYQHHAKIKGELSV